MKELQTVGNVSRNLGISNRMLRYYEQIGLVQSRRTEGYAYRVYDENAIRRLRQIIILRKLRISVKQICEILDDGDAVKIIEVFERNISELNEEITALSTVRSILTSLVAELQERTSFHIQLDWLDGSSSIALVDALSFPSNTLREEQTMEKLDQASKKLSKLTDRDVRVVYLPAATVASIHIIGLDPAGGSGFYPEEKTGEMVDEFILAKNLPEIKPDFRCYGFNHPNGSNDGGPAEDHGYERWVTIPDDMDVPLPFTKKRFEGGLYGAHMIPMGNFEEWGWLLEWGFNNERYTPRLGKPDLTKPDGLMEEGLNAYGRYGTKKMANANVQLDLLIPIAPK